ncbi:MAG: anhydro-N-acetylmuramic acid kinase [Ignavibacteria bacterium]|nr:anhydro-N-acetylmuramic acid kinase [Ignavibacteria bacterium]
MINNEHWLELNKNHSLRGIPTPEEWLSRSRYIIGIMTGTSVDSIDITLAKFIGSKSKHFIFSIISHDSYPFPETIKIGIENAIRNTANPREIASLNFELAYLFSKTTKDFLAKNNFPIEKVDAIGVHGQTIWHEPKPLNGRKKGFTMQLVSLSTMAQLLKVPIVGDFRAKDIAAGGEGAPLVPIFDYEFFSSKENDIIALNIGGIANITYIPKNAKINQVVAFDTGPGNILIDNAVKILFNANFDKNGEIARKGRIISQLFKKLKSIPFVRRKPPKSTGRELYNQTLLNELIDFANSKKIDYCDIVTTLTHYTGWSIAENIKKFANPMAKIIVSGGGAKNLFLMKTLRTYLPTTEILTSEELGIPVQVKESLAFAFLAYLRIGEIPSNIPNVTGAKERISLGIIAW